MAVLGLASGRRIRFGAAELVRVAIAAAFFLLSALLLLGALLPSSGPATRLMPLVAELPAALNRSRGNAPTHRVQASLAAPIHLAVSKARAVNARAPLVTAGFLAAEPFMFRGSTEDRLRATACLTAAAVYEAGGDRAEQGAVIQVILNRLRHPAFPRTICGVVFQGSERTTGCQFTFTCDGAMRRWRPSAGTWTQARTLASEALMGRVEPKVGYATHYHTDWVAPPWSRQMDKIAISTGHLFFRWRGAAGRANIFTAAHAGREPNVAALAPITPVHVAGSSVQVAALAVTAAALPAVAGPALPQVAPQAPTAADLRRLPSTARAPDEDTFLVTLSPGSDPNGFAAAARRVCGGRDYCRFIGWTDPRLKASRLPIAGSSIDAISFSYTRLSAGAPEQLRWNCSEFPRANKSECLIRGA